MKNITTNIEIIRNTNGGAKVYNCSFCRKYRTKSYWSMYAHALNCSYCNSKAYKMGWNTVFKLVGLAIGI